MKSRSPRRIVALIGAALVLMIEGLWLLIGFMVQSIIILVIVSGIMVFTVYFLYLRLLGKKRARYPMVPPEGRADIYFPRTNIPRPVHDDFRRMEEKKRRLDKARRKRRKPNT